MAQLPTFPIAEFAAWVRTKPADEWYDFTEAEECAVAQFGCATDRPHLIGLMGSQIDVACPGLLDAVMVEDAESTFGALASRLEALAPEPSIWISVDAYMSENARVSA